MHKEYLRGAFLLTAAWLIGLGAITVLLAEIVNRLGLNVSDLLYLTGFAQLVAASLILASTLRNLRTTKPPKLQDNYAERDLPTLSVCIPARNETEALEACLQSLIASDYPKLEVLVLDDCSQNKRTPEIIRGFAQDGVRFIAGKEPPERWLAKNYACQQLAAEANGELLLFCGVDVRFTPQSLSTIVKTLLQKKKSMISFVPKNILSDSWNLKDILLQPSRYAWELSLPRRLLNRPPVLSTCWIIKRASLEKVGGFAAVARKPVPESYFARLTAIQNDGYSFLQADEAIGLVSRKAFDEQQSTAVRTRYPQLRRRPELTAAASLSELFILVLPFTTFLASLATGWWLLALLSAINCVVLVTAYSLIATLTFRRFIWPSLWLLPFAALYDIGLLNYSMLKYEFGKVIWKDRNVCIPVMRAIPNLPKLS